MEFLKLQNITESKQKFILSKNLNLSKGTKNFKIKKYMSGLNTKPPQKLEDKRRKKHLFSMKNLRLRRWVNSTTNYLNKMLLLKCLTEP